MSPAKLLGLPQTEDSIIVRRGGNGTLRMQIFPSDRTGAEEGDPPGSRKVLHSLIAIRKRGEKK